MNDRDVRTLNRALAYCDNVAEFLQKIDGIEAYRDDFKTQYACDMRAIQLGELVGRLSDELKSLYPEIPWVKIRAMRNIYAHDYDNVKIEYVWGTLTKDVPALKIELQKILNEG